MSSIIFGVFFAGVSQVYNMYPRLFSWIENRQKMLDNRDTSVKDVKDLIKHLKETLNPNMCRGLVDCFLIRQQKDEVRLLRFCVSQLWHQQQCSTCLFYNMWLFFPWGIFCHGLSLQWNELDIHGDQPVRSRYWHYSSDIEMGFAAHGQKSTYTRWNERGGLLIYVFPSPPCTAVILTYGMDRNSSTAFGLPWLLLSFNLCLKVWLMTDVMAWVNTPGERQLV